MVSRDIRFQTAREGPAADAQLPSDSFKRQPGKRQVRVARPVHRSEPSAPRSSTSAPFSVMICALQDFLSVVHVPPSCLN